MAAPSKKAAPEAADLEALSIEELRELLAEVQVALDAKVETRRQELLAELNDLGGLPQSTGRKASAPADETRKRASPKPMYRTPDGSFEWSGRGAIPRAFKDLGVTDREGMEQYKIGE